MKKIHIVTHSGAFHADDVCAIACLDILYAGNISVTRTREQSIIDTGDIVLDVGGLSDGQKFFDHHQAGGAGKRENAIPYASFGLIWKRFGKELAGGDAAAEKVAEKFDRIFVSPVDAIDNGVQIVESKFGDVYPLSFNSMILMSNPTWEEEEHEKEKGQQDGQSEASIYDRCFFESVASFKKIILRTLEFLKSQEKAKALVLADYQAAADKRVVVLSGHYPFQEVLSSLPEPLFAIYKSPQLESWHIKAIWQEGSEKTFKNRKNFPAAWAGKMDAQLEAVTGVAGSLFCHNALFLVITKTKEGALTIAQKAIAE